MNFWIYAQCSRIRRCWDNGNPVLLSAKATSLIKRSRKKLMQKSREITKKYFANKLINVLSDSLIVSMIINGRARKIQSKDALRKLQKCIVNKITKCIWVKYFCPQKLEYFIQFIAHAVSSPHATTISSRSRFSPDFFQNIELIKNSPKKTFFFFAC